MKSNAASKCAIAILILGGVPFFFIHGVWGELLLKAYLLTALLAYILLSSYWESSGQRWFWEAMALVLLFHSPIVLALAKLNLEFPQIDRIPMATYSVLTLILGAELLISLRIIEAFRRKSRKLRHPH